MEINFQIKEKIEAFLQSMFEKSTLFIAEVKVLPNTKIEVYIDKTDCNITIDECAKISRKLEEYLETNQLVGEKYTLEVSSPGMDQPLKVIQQYQKNIGKNIEIVMNGGIKIIGKLIAFNENTIEVEIEKKIKKESHTEKKEIALSEIKSIKKHFIFKI